MKFDRALLWKGALSLLLATVMMLASASVTV